MAAKKGNRVKVVLACTECKQRNYDNYKNGKTTTERLELNKYCKFCKKHTVHKESKQERTGMAQTKTKKPGLFKRLGRFFKQSWSELKKVSWPNFNTVVKNTGIVLAVVLFFLLVILGVDMLFSFLLIQLPNGPVGA